MINKEQIEFLNECTKGKWALNEKTGLVDIEGGFDCYSRELTDFKGVKFGVVTEKFICSYNSLKSLEGAPQKVGGNFNCNNNSLTSLVGAPRKVGGGFDCDNNSLTSLEGAPQDVGENFNCSDNKLTSLVGAPQEVGGGFRCYDNKLTSLVGAPQKVGGGFDCDNNSLTSLVGAPQDVGGGFSCLNNSLTSLEGAPQKVGWSFYCSNNPISVKTLMLVLETMQEKKIDYWFALSLLKSQIKGRDWKLLEGELNERLSKDTQKGVSMLDKFRIFE